MASHNGIYTSAAKKKKKIIERLNHCKIVQFMASREIKEIPHRGLNVLAVAMEREAWQTI